MRRIVNILAKMVSAIVLALIFLPLLVACCSRFLPLRISSLGRRRK